MTFNELTVFVKKPGIYYFRNTLNNKYYIGQAQEIRDRLMKHKTNFETNHYPDAHLYRAWRKYGIEVFEVGVLEVVDLPVGEERNNKLDELEIKYIKEYNSYGTGGYNQTLGGDGGIKGYKFTDLQKLRVRINGLQMSIDGRNKIYFYDTKTKQYGEALSFHIITDALNKTDNVRYVENQTCYFGRYIFSKTKENLDLKIKKYYSRNYYYSLTNEIDNNTKDFQKEIDKKTAEIRKEIDDFYEKYGHAKYNRKDNKTKKEAIRKLQKEDLMKGISKEDYKQKYHIKSNQTFYEHVQRLYPDWEPIEKENKIMNISSNGIRQYRIPTNHMTDEMKEDILKGMSCIRFVQKYNSSEASYYRYKHKLEEQMHIKIRVSFYREPGKAILKEQEEDILNGIGCIDYMKKYDLVEATYYDHRKIIAKKYPEHKFKKNNARRVKVDIELIRDDILNGMSKREFCLKHNLSESCYKKYKKKLFNDYKISSNLTEEMIEDIKNGIRASEYTNKYNVSNDTFYNHRRAILPPEQITKRYITLKDVISEEQRNDILNGMRMVDYIQKYNCESETYYKHRKFIIPDDNERCKSRYDYKKKRQCGITDEQKNDILNGMSERDFIIKHDLSRKTYHKYKKMLLQKESEEQ